jgi:hypothetical protein
LLRATKRFIENIWASRTLPQRRWYYKRICSRRRRLICPTGKSVNWLSSPLCKNISLHPSGKSSLQIRAIPPHHKGRIAIVTDAGWDAVDAAAFCAQRDRRAGDEPVSDQQHADERCCQRTAKSCGPDTPTLVSSSRSCVGPTGLRQNHIRGTTVAKQPGHRGEHEGNR